MSAPIIRGGTDADGPAIGGVLASVFAEYPGCLYEPSEFPELAAVASHYRRRGGALWVVEAAGRVGGCCALYRSPAAECFELSKVYLLRDLRGRGLARRLVELARDHAAASGARRIELFTDTRFLDAHGFYERQGFARLPGLRFLGDVSDSWEFHYERWL